MDDIDSLEYTIPDCKNKSEKQLKEALIERLINAYYNQINNKFSQRKDNSYDRQDLTDALDALHSYQDGAAYDVLQQFVDDYFDGYI